MKNLISRLLKLTFVFALSFTLFACKTTEGGGSSQEPEAVSYAGEYKLTQLSYGSDPEDESFSGEGVVGKLVLNEDGTGAVDVFGQHTEFTWVQEAKTITTNENTVDFTFENDVIEFSLDDSYVYQFTKVR